MAVLEIDAVGDVVEEGSEEIAFVGEGFLHFAAAGDVPENSLDTDDIAVGVIEGGFDDLDVDFAAVGRPVIFDDGARDTPVYDRARLKAGQRFAGPAVIEEPASVTVVRPGDAVRIDDYGNILLGRIAAG